MSWLVLLFVYPTWTRPGPVGLLKPATSHEEGFKFFSQFDDMFGGKFWETDTNLVARFPTSPTTPRPISTAKQIFPPPPFIDPLHSLSPAEQQPVRAGNLWDQQTFSAPAASNPASPSFSSEPVAAHQVQHFQAPVHQHSPSPFVPFQSTENFPKVPTASREEPPVLTVRGGDQRAPQSPLPSTIQGDAPQFPSSGPDQSVLNQPNPPPVDVSNQQWAPVFDPTWSAPPWTANEPSPSQGDPPSFPASVSDSSSPLTSQWNPLPAASDQLRVVQQVQDSSQWAQQVITPEAAQALEHQPSPHQSVSNQPNFPPVDSSRQTWSPQPSVFDPTWPTEPWAAHQPFHSTLDEPLFPNQFKKSNWTADNLQPLSSSNQPSPFPFNTPPVVPPAFPFQFNNIGALPSLPSPLSPPLMASDEDCYSERGEIGSCATVDQCEQSGGYSGGLCHQGLDRSRVCCIFSAQCGYQTNHRTTYFRSPPSFPPTSCTHRINLLPDVCQVRLDFLDFRVAPLTQGFCDPANRLLLSTGHHSATVSMKEFCGTLAIQNEDQLRTDLPHIYVHFDRDVRPGEPLIPNKNSPPHLSLEMLTSNYPASWNIRVSQVTCDGAPLQAPPGCSQFYNSASGTISSPNLLDREYPASTSLTACLARDNSACAVRYKLKQLQLGPSKTGGLGYGLVCRDYLKFLGEKTGICGVGDGRDMVLPVKGPVGLTFRSDKFHMAGADVGYEVEYEYLYQCTADTAFFRYPVAK